MKKFIIIFSVEVYDTKIGTLTAENEADAKRKFNKLYPKYSLIRINNWSDIKNLPDLDKKKGRR